MVMVWQFVCACMCVCLCVCVCVRVCVCLTVTVCVHRSVIWCVCVVSCLIATSQLRSLRQQLIERRQRRQRRNKRRAELEKLKVSLCLALVFRLLVQLCCCCPPARICDFVVALNQPSIHPFVFFYAFVHSSTHPPIHGCVYEYIQPLRIHPALRPSVDSSMLPWLIEPACLV